MSRLYRLGALGLLAVALSYFGESSDIGVYAQAGTPTAATTSDPGQPATSKTRASSPMR